MKLKTVQIVNFRRFSKVIIPMSDYTCFVGENGVGKSTVLAALNVFFCENIHSSTDTSRLSAEDFHQRQTQSPIEITVTFADLTNEAKEALSDYVRNDELTVTAEAAYDDDTLTAVVRHYGIRMGMAAFGQFFEAVKNGASKAELTSIYSLLQEKYVDLPPYGRSKDIAEGNLREYEQGHPELQESIKSSDNFYGIVGASKLKPYLTWVYVPAVKDASEEEKGSRDTALGKLIERASGGRNALDSELAKLKADTIEKYRGVLATHDSSLSAVASSLQVRLKQWSHSLATISLQWISDATKEVQLQNPFAGLSAGDGGFNCSLSRLGHGLQRSYLLALLHELAASGAADGPTLVIACEEPELFQHPPRARDLFDVLVELSSKGDQVLVTTHSPVFVQGQQFEDVRLVRPVTAKQESVVSYLDVQDVVSAIRAATKEKVTAGLTGAIAKLHQSLQPHMAEMLFCRIPVLVEGYEDAAYITAYLHASGNWRQFRAVGCYLIPVSGKSRLVTAVVLAKKLDIRPFVVFDADGGNVRERERPSHERDNSAILQLLESSASPFPEHIFVGTDHVVWPENIGDSIDREGGPQFAAIKEKVRVKYEHEGNLEKNSFFVADLVTDAIAGGLKLEPLATVCDAILRFAREA